MIWYRFLCIVISDAWWFHLHQVTHFIQLPQFWEVVVKPLAPMGSIILLANDDHKGLSGTFYSILIHYMVMWEASKTFRKKTLDLSLEMKSGKSCGAKKKNPLNQTSICKIGTRMVLHSTQIELYKQKSGSRLLERLQSNLYILIFLMSLL